MNKSRGFTLLEVLVAGVILFSVIATVSLIYQNTMSSLKLSEKHLNIAASVPFLVDEVRDEIRNNAGGKNELVGKGRNIGIDFYWEAKVIESIRPRRSAIDVSDEKVKQKIKLWMVKLKFNDKGYTKEYAYRELSWEID